MGSPPVLGRELDLSRQRLLQNWQQPQERRDSLQSYPYEEAILEFLIDRPGPHRQHQLLHFQPSLPRLRPLLDLYKRRAIRTIIPLRHRDLQDHGRPLDSRRRAPPPRTFVISHLRYYDRASPRPAWFQTQLAWVGDLQEDQLPLLPQR